MAMNTIIVIAPKNQPCDPPFYMNWPYPAPGSRFIHDCLSMTLTPGQGAAWNFDLCPQFKVWVIMHAF